ncbi:MAG: ABC transporter permease [Bacillota bacterium]
MQRIRALVQKEFIQMRRDRRTLAMMIVLPLVWLVIFGYAFSFDVSDLRVAVVDESGTNIGARLAEAILSYEKFVPVRLTVPWEDIRQAVEQERVDMAVFIPPGFGRVSDGSTDARLKLIIDGSQLFKAQAAARMLQRAMEPVQDEIGAEVRAQVEEDVRRRLETELARRTDEAREKAQALVESRAPAVSLPEDLFRPPSLAELDFEPPAPPRLIPEIEILYNPDLKSAPVMIPGLLGLVVMFMTTLLTSLGIVREREFGTLEQLVVTPIRPLELVLGKLLPYVAVAAVDFALVLLAGTYLFDLRVAGNLWLFCGLTLLFLLTTLGLGLLISTVSGTQQQAMQLSFFCIFPQILLSGLIFPLTSMPAAIQYIAYLLPFTYFVPIARGIFIKGYGLELLWQPVAVLAAYGVAMIVFAAVRFRKRLG